jgi:hypothetical protein
MIKKEGVSLKKVALICSLMLAFASISYANNNANTTLDISSEKSVAISVSDNTSSEAKYLTSNEKIQKVTFINNEMASEICGEKFSTAYFNEQYEKLALLKRCELNLRTVPLPIWNLDKYVEQGVELSFAELGINKIFDIKFFVDVEKIGKHKVITVANLFKQNKKLYVLNTSLVSIKDNLYAISTYDVNDKVFAPKEDAKHEEVPPVIQRMREKEEAKIVNIAPADLDAEVKTAIWEEHKKFIKKFKPVKSEEITTKK